jgi:hypothetical protein
MKKTAVFLFALLLILCFVSCSGSDKFTIPEGARTLDGCYKTDKLNAEIGYVFYSDGYGVLMIGENAYQMTYYILGNNLITEVFSTDKGIKNTSTFTQGKDYIRIDGIKYDKVKADELSSAEVS